MAPRWAPRERPEAQLDRLAANLGALNALWAPWTAPNRWPLDWLGCLGCVRHGWVGWADWLLDLSCARLGWPQTDLRAALVFSFEVTIHFSLGSLVSIGRVRRAGR